MTGVPYAGPPGGTWPQPGGNLPFQQPKAPRTSKAPLIVGIAVGLIGIAVGVVSWFRPAAAPPPSASAQPAAYSDKEATNAKKALCEAHQRVSRATSAAGAEKSNDPLTQFAISNSIRMTAALGADYLFRALEDHPAAPEDLADAMRQLAESYQDMLLLQVSKAENSEIDPIYAKIDQLDPEIEQRCA